MSDQIVAAALTTLSRHDLRRVLLSLYEREALAVVGALREVLPPVPSAPVTGTPATARPAGAVPRQRCVCVSQYARTVSDNDGDEWFRCADGSYSLGTVRTSGSRKSLDDLAANWGPLALPNCPHARRHA